jgi:hypothetical protein
MIWGSSVSDQVVVSEESRLSGTQRPRSLSAQPLTIVAILAILLGIGLRLLDARLPLWLDEVLTAVIVMQPNFGELIPQILRDANAPLYYVLMYYWTHLFGISEVALRFPAFLFGAMTPALALIPIKAIHRDTRFVWAISLAFWLPGIWYSQEARCYSLVLFMATGCTLAYARLLDAPSLRRAALWVVLASLGILSHYYAAILVGCQGLAYLWMHRRQALRTWPAALLFIPALAWIGVHLPWVLKFSGGNAWQSRLRVEDLPGVANFLLGGIAAAALLSLLALAPLYLYRKLRGATPAPASSPPLSAAAQTAAATAAMGAAVLILMGVLTPSFVDRYLMSFAPGIMLGVALIISWLGRRDPLVPLTVAIALAAFAGIWASGSRASAFKEYNFEVASQTLMQAGIKHLVFVLDSPMASVIDRGQLDATGAFFLRRAGHSVTSETVVLRPDQDPHAQIIAAANRPNTGILWIYDLSVRSTVAKNFPPRLGEAGSGWKCQHIRHAVRFNVGACHRGA